MQVLGQGSAEDAVSTDQRGELCCESAYCHFLVEGLGIHQVADGGWGSGLGGLVSLG